MCDNCHTIIEQLTHNNRTADTQQRDDRHRRWKTLLLTSLHPANSKGLWPLTLIQRVFLVLVLKTKMHWICRVRRYFLVHYIKHPNKQPACEDHSLLFCVSCRGLSCQLSRTIVSVVADYRFSCHGLSCQLSQMLSDASCRL